MGIGTGNSVSLLLQTPGKSAAISCSWCSQQLQARVPRLAPGLGRYPALPPCPTLPAVPKGLLHPRQWVLPAGKSKAQGRELFVPSAIATSALSSSWGRMSLPGCVSGAEPALSSHNRGPGSPDNPSLLWGQPKITEALFGTSISDQGQTLL